MHSNFTLVQSRIHNCLFAVVFPSQPPAYAPPPPPFPHTTHHYYQSNQVHRQFRKPLIVMSPKSLLRHPKVRTSSSRRRRRAP